MEIREDVSLGIDLGIGSCGWAVIRQSGNNGEIIALGVRTFDVPETDEKRTPTNQLRRQFRGMRRVLRRRRQRMNAIRGLFAKTGLIDEPGPDALAVGLDPWQLRADGLERALSPIELAVALGHIARHRGFRSNSKRDRGANASKDSSAMLEAIDATRDRLGRWRTVGEMFARDPYYAGRKRNRDGDYARSVLREDQEHEVRRILARQRQLGAFSDNAFEARFLDLAFSQRPLADSEDTVGACPFEPEEKRAAKRARSFELFRFLARLTALRVGGRPLTAEELTAAAAEFGGQRGMTFKRLRKTIGLDPGERFDGLPPDDEGRRDVVNRSSSNGCMQGTAVLRAALGDTAWRSLLMAPEKLDRIAFVLTFREDLGSIRAGLEDVGLDPVVLDSLMTAAVQGDFADFRGAGHVSARVCRAVIPHLLQGKTYDKAMRAAGYRHTDRERPILAGLSFHDSVKAQVAWAADRIANPVARKALTEALKQAAAIIHEYGLPGRIHVEVARDVGKSKDMRDEISRGIERRNRQKDRLREEYCETVGRQPAGADDLLRFELWKEQNGRCLYTDQPISPAALVASDNSVQVDHILPWSRSGDDSYLNKALCIASANQEKKGRTPFEWLGPDEARWAAFAAGVESNRALKGLKKRNYLLRDASVLETKFRPRNLNDTRYACRLLADALAAFYPADDTIEEPQGPHRNRRRVFTRPGALTDRLRRGWGLQRVKKDDAGKRIADDRHHALDALIVAATSESALQRFTRLFQDAEAKGSHRDFSRLDPPWPGFIQEAREKLAAVFVSRAERRRARGAAHAATVRQISDRDGVPVVYERKAIANLSDRDLDRIKDADRNARLVGSLRAWIAAGSPKDAPPLSPKGDPIRKVRVATGKKPDVLVRAGAADRGVMVRVDVFRKQTADGSQGFFLVPIYPHQVGDPAGWPAPPDRAVAGGRDEADWPVIDSTYAFLFAVYPLSFLELVKPDGEIVEGYFRSLDRSTGAMTISPDWTKAQIRKGIGTRTLASLRKFTVDRLGRRYEVRRETRTWRGAACI